MYLRIRVDNRLPTVLRDSCSKSVNCQLIKEVYVRQYCYYSDLQREREY